MAVIGAKLPDGHVMVWAVGGEEFISFDRQAVKLLAAGGNAARLLA
ncbi:MAG: hypothetical protein ACYCZB_03635 [Acidiphilium sp.]